MDQLRAMRVFARVVDDGSFAQAARSLDMAPPVVTRLLAELEQHLGARLLNRTTRRLSLTEVGEQYLDKVRSILAGVDEAAELAADATRLPRGHLRLLCPPAIAVHQLSKHLPRFQAQFPQVTLEITSPGPVETVDEGYDLTIFTSREAPDGRFIARRLARAAGIGRGVDFVLYPLVIWLVREALLSRRRRHEAQERMTELTRAIAISSAREV